MKVLGDCKNLEKVKFFIFLGAFLCLLTMRSLIGLDFTDEIQYYYQAIGLAETNRFFSNDLYIQQLVYVFVLPFFKAYLFAFGDTGIILFGRALCVIGLIFLCWFCCRRLVGLGLEPSNALLAAVALSFAVTHHSIFAVSYNTVAQAMWIVFALLFASPKTVRPWWWAATIVVAGVAYPVAGLVMAAILLIYLLVSKQFDPLLRVIGFGLLFGALGLAVILSLTDFEDVMRSLRFSSGFSVGSFWTDREMQRDYLAILLLMLAALFAPAPRGLRNLLLVVLFCLTCLFLFAIVHDILEFRAAGLPYPGPRTDTLAGWPVLCAVAQFTARTAARSNGSSEWPIRAVGIVAICQFTAFAGTSSGGVIAGVAAMMILLPIATALATLGIRAERGVGRWMPHALLFGVLSIYLTLWQLTPYRDPSTFFVGRSFTDVSIFKGILVSNEKVPVIEAFQKEFDGKTEGQGGLILSGFPGIYAVLEAKPETCMIYNHFVSDPQIAGALIECIGSKSPKFILNLEDHATLEERTRTKEEITSHIAKANSLECERGSVEFEAVFPGMSDAVAYTFCQ